LGHIRKLNANKQGTIRSTSVSFNLATTAFLCGHTVSILFEHFYQQSEALSIVPANHRAGAVKHHSTARKATWLKRNYFSPSIAGHSASLLRDSAILPSRERTEPPLPMVLPPPRDHKLEKKRKGRAIHKRKITKVTPGGLGTLKPVF
jgi:hypothetical protein